MMNQKKIILLLLLNIISAYSFSQWGVRGGLNLATLTSGIEENNYKNSYGLGGQLGTSYDLHMSNKFVFQPQFLFLYESYNREIPGIDIGDPLYKENSNSFALSLPLLFSFRYPVKNDTHIVFDLGPFISCGLFGNYEVETWNNGVQVNNTSFNLYSDQRSLLDTGLMGGVGYETNSLLFSAQAKYGLSRVTSDNDKTVTYLFSIGYKIKR